MHLKSIELSGFKSFAKRSTLDFNSPISSIVGPNGSGKSNVAEAFRFVLGEQSMKSMRGKRGEDLIWNGTSTEPRSSRASVKVFFDNLDKLFNIDFPEVTIERVVHRDGVNDYFINGAASRLKDVIELLVSAHIGASGHHIISQGEADKILSASPKDRKVIIEEALGLKTYQYRRLESERKLTKTFENIGQVEALRKEIAPHLKFLAKQVEKFEKVGLQRSELLSLALDYFKRESTYLSNCKASISEEKKPLSEALEKLSLESKHAKQVIELESGLNALEKEKDELTRELGKLDGFIIAERRIIENEKRLVASDETKTVKLKELEVLNEEIKNLSDAGIIKDRLGKFINERKHQTDSKLINESESRIKDLEISRVKLETALEELKKKEREISEAEKSLFRIMSEESELVSSLNIIKMREEKLVLEEDEFKRELQEVSVLVGHEILAYKNMEVPAGAEDESRERQDDRKRNISKLKIRLEDSNVSGADEVQREYKETSERDAFLARELEDLNKTANTLSELIKELEDRLAREFSSGLENINKEFLKLFSSMFDGGSAELVLVRESSRNSDPENILEDEDTEAQSESGEIIEGLDIKVNLPKKKVKSLVMLSGGERALTSIALIFAISQVNPPPFIILDETDAALDESNSRKYGDMVEILSKRSQLILITHNRETMSRASIIYGVTMGSSGVSKLLSISFDEAVTVAK